MTTTHPTRVVGRGLAGLAVAFELARRGRPVVVHGPRAAVGTASLAAVGVSSVKGNARAETPLFAAKIAGHNALWPWLAAIEAASGETIPRRRGLLEPFADVMGYEAIRERVFHREWGGLRGAQVLGRKDLPKFIHTLGIASQQLAGAFSWPDEVWVDPPLLLGALEAAVARLGGSFAPAEVLAVRLETDQGVQLETASGAVSAPNVVLAAGYATRALLERSGLPALGLQGVAGETLVGDAAVPSSDLLPGSDGILNFGKVNLALSGGRYLYGSSSYRWQQGDASPPSRLFVEQLITALGAFPALARPSEVRWGVRARTRDLLPVVGPLFCSERERLFVVTGLHKSGLQLAPWAARHVADAIENTVDFASLAAFSPARFAR
jgi:glycine oxidase